MNEALFNIDLINQRLHDRREEPFQYIIDKNSAKHSSPIKNFYHISEWRDYLINLQIYGINVPKINADQYNEALRILFLAWFEPLLTKLAEFKALCALESALRDAYCQQWQKQIQSKKKCKEKLPSLGEMIQYMTEHDNLPTLFYNKPKAARDGKTDKPPNWNTFNSIRNDIAHCKVLNTMQYGGLINEVREIIRHAYRNNDVANPSEDRREENHARRTGER